MAAGYPTKPTWLVTINNCFLTTSPLLTERASRKRFLELAEMAKGHIRQQWQQLRSIKPNSTNNHKQLQRLKGQDTYAPVYNMKKIMYINQTGAFPIRSSLGNHYLMILHEIDSNAILVELMKNRSSGKINKAYKELKHLSQKTHIKQWWLWWFPPTNQTSWNNLQKGTITHVLMQWGQKGNTDI